MDLPWMALAWKKSISCMAEISDTQLSYRQHHTWFKNRIFHVEGKQGLLGITNKQFVGKIRSPPNPKLIVANPSETDILSLETMPENEWLSRILNRKMRLSESFSKIEVKTTVVFVGRHLFDLHEFFSPFPCNSFPLRKGKSVP